MQSTEPHWLQVSTDGLTCMRVLAIVDIARASWMLSYCHLRLCLYMMLTKRSFGCVHCVHCLWPCVWMWMPLYAELYYFISKEFVCMFSIWVGGTYVWDIANLNCVVWERANLILSKECICIHVCVWYFFFRALNWLKSTDSFLVAAIGGNGQNECFINSAGWTFICSMDESYDLYLCSLETIHEWE